MTARRPNPTNKQEPTSSNSPATESTVTVDNRSKHSCIWKWEIQNFQKLIVKSLNSPSFEVGGFNFDLLSCPNGDSLYLQIKDPGGSKFDCFSSYKLTIVNHVTESKSLCIESYYRFSRERKSIGWSDSEVSKTILDPESGFLSNGSLLISVDISILDEMTSFSCDDEKEEPTSSTSSESDSLVLNGTFTWKINNYSLFKEKIKTHKIISPGFDVVESSLRLALNTSMVDGVEHLALFMEVEDTKKAENLDQSCWCMFKISVLNQKQGLKRMHRDSNGRFGRDSTRIGWNDYMTMSDFIGPDKGFLMHDTVKLCVSFNAIKDSSSLMNVKSGWKSRGLVSRKSNLQNKYMRKFKWQIENFTRFKDHLKKKDISGLAVRSKRFRIANQDFCLLVYPRGQSQKSSHLAMFLEVLDAQNKSGDCSCFVNYRLSVVNQKDEDDATEESQNHISTATKAWGWPEFMTLSNLYDDSGYSLEGTVVFTAEVSILKDTLVMRDATGLGDNANQSITWKMENFLSFKETIATQKIFSKFFKVGRCELRIGVYVTGDTIRGYLECDPSVELIDPDKKFWVHYKMAVVNQNDPNKTLWEESSLLTMTSMTSELQLMKLSDMLEASAGFVVGEKVVLGCEILDYCPSFEFSEQEVWARTEVDILRTLLATAGCHLNEEDPHPLVTLREVCQMDFSDVAGLLVGLRFYHDDPVTMHLVCAPGFSGSDGGIGIMKALNLLQPKIDDLLLDIMIECCQPLKGRSSEDSYDASSEPSPDSSGAVCQSESPQEIRPETSAGVHQDLRPTGTFKSNWSEPSVELLVLIVNSLKALNGPVSQGHPDPGQELYPAEKISILLDKAPKQLLPDLVKLLPKLVNDSVVTYALLDQLQRLDAEPELPPPIFILQTLAVISQLHLRNEVCEHALSKADDILRISNNEALGYAILFLFNAASKCQSIPQAAKAVRKRLESLGDGVSPSVLDVLRNTMNSIPEVAEALLGEIDSVFESDEKCLVNLDGSSLYGENGQSVDELLFGNDSHFSDIFILIAILAVPSIEIEIEASQVFESGVAHGFIVDRIVAMVLEVCFLGRTGVESVSSAENFEHRGIAGKNSLCAEDVFRLLLSLAETLSLSRDSRVQGFVEKFYSLLFRLFAHESYHKRMLKVLFEKLRNSKAVLLFYKSVKDRFALENKELSEQIQEVEIQSKQLCSERDEANRKLCNVETQLSQLKSQQRDELEKAIKEK